MPLEAQGITTVQHRGDFFTAGMNTGLEGPGTAQQHEAMANLSGEQTSPLQDHEVCQTTLSTLRLHSELLNPGPSI